ncbi:hypothetical protein H6784_05240 [Candidatus Nomurabacteria bacterium]|nr:hypothetical protein [Candidatus Kaiserbacteria bacterium]MCB9814784.1 hypothetical protein [Candidatus Nomurabacteria bacterium]
MTIIRVGSGFTRKAKPIPPFEHYQTLGTVRVPEDPKTPPGLWLRVNYNNTPVTDDNLPYLQHRSLSPGDQLHVSVFISHQDQTLENCLRFLKRRHAVYPGIKGLLSVATQMGDDLPEHLFSVLFHGDGDEQEVSNHCCNTASCICNKSPGLPSFLTFAQDVKLLAGFPLLCFSEIN